MSVFNPEGVVSLAQGIALGSHSRQANHRSPSHRSKNGNAPTARRPGSPKPLCPSLRVFVVNPLSSVSARTRALPRTARQRQNPIVPWQAPVARRGGVCLPRSHLKPTAETSPLPVRATHPPTRVGGSPRFAKLPTPHGWGGGARKGGGEVSRLVPFPCTVS